MQLSAVTHVAAVYGGGVMADDRPYLVTEFCGGGTLEEHVATVGRLTSNEASQIGAKLAGALVAAHQQHIFHRNVKPANVLINGAGEPMLAGFGLLSVAVSDPTPPMRPTPQAFVAPEAYLPELMSSAADIYSLGATIYALLAGTPSAITSDTCHPRVTPLGSGPRGAGLLHDGVSNVGAHEGGAREGGVRESPKGGGAREAGRPSGGSSDDGSPGGSQQGGAHHVGMPDAGSSDSSQARAEPPDAKSSTAVRAGPDASNPSVPDTPGRAVAGSLNEPGAGAPSMPSSPTARTYRSEPVGRPGISWAGTPRAPALIVDGECLADLPHVSGALMAVLRRAMAHDPRDRYPSAEDLLAALIAL